MSSYKQTLNKFSHMDIEEFFRTSTGYLPESVYGNISPFRSPRRIKRLATPENWSWLDIPNIVGPATDQKQCGSCTIFASLGVMESHMRIWYGINTKLSEQEAMQCCGGCDGGQNINVFKYAKNGATSGEDFKYEARVLEECNTIRPRVPGSKVTGYHRIEKGVDAVKNAMWHLVNVGPLVTGFCVPHSFHSYQSGVFDDEDMKECGWHAVMVVGFGTENGIPYWLCRNSWGEFKF